MAIDLLENINLNNLMQICKNNTVVTYRKLTEIIGIKYCYGNQKKEQLNLLKKYCSYTKNEHFYRINEVYIDENNVVNNISTIYNNESDYERNNISNVNKVELNKEYKYSELQELFNIYGKSGAQTLKDISKEYKVVKVKRGTYKIIRELSALEKIENQVYCKNKDYLEPIIYYMLLNTKENSITMDMHELMEYVEIVNKDFHYIKYNTKECSQIMGTDESGLYLFTRESEPMLKRVIRDILYDMNDRQLIKVTEIPILAFRIYDGTSHKYYTRTQQITTVKDVQELLEIKRKILKEKYNVKKESELGYYDRGEFRDLIAKEYEADYFYYKYNIILNKKGLQECEECDIIGLRKSFNEYIQEKLKASKQGSLKDLSKEDKDIYVKYCIDTAQDFKLREKKK